MEAFLHIPQAEHPLVRSCQKIAVNDVTRGVSFPGFEESFYAIQCFFNLHAIREKESENDRTETLGNKTKKAFMYF